MSFATASDIALVPTGLDLGIPRGGGGGAQPLPRAAGGPPGALALAGAGPVDLGVGAEVLGAAATGLG